MTVPKLSGSANIGTLQSKAPEMYKAMSDYTKYPFIPKVTPDGEYDITPPGHKSRVAGKSSTEPAVIFEATYNEDGTAKEGSTSTDGY